MDSFIKKVPVSIIIATANRVDALSTTLASIHLQHIQPQEIIIVDASEQDDSKKLCSTKYPSIIWKKADAKGAAVQRNQGVVLASCPFIGFMDDDIILEESCIENLWLAMNSSQQIGGVNAMITNQQYHSPGKVTRFMYQLMHGKKISSYAGLCIGPAWNLLPEDNNTLPVIQEVGWLNTTCTFYRKEALPNPPFQSHFKGYSLMEDVTLSLEVGKSWKLYNARTARIYHDSQPGSHKNNVRIVAAMQLVNRHYVMSKVLQRKAVPDYLKLLVFEIFGLATSLTNAKGWKQLVPSLIGKLQGVYKILIQKN